MSASKAPFLGLNSVVLKSKGGEALLWLTANTIRTVHQISLQFFENSSQTTDEAALIKNTIRQFSDQVEAYAKAERDLGSEPTWLRVFEPVPQISEEEHLKLIASTYEVLEK